MLNGILQSLWFSCTCQSRASPSSSACRKTQQLYITSLRECWKHLRYSVFPHLLQFIFSSILMPQIQTRPKNPNWKKNLPQAHLYPQYIFPHPVFPPILVLFSARQWRNVIKGFLSSIQSHSPFNSVWVMRELELTCQIDRSELPCQSPPGKEGNWNLTILVPSKIRVIFLLVEDVGCIKGWSPCVVEDSGRIYIRILWILVL